MEFNNIFQNNKYIKKKGVYIINESDDYTTNFGEQWKDYRYVQIDSYNNNSISYNFLKKLIFNNEKILNNKNILEIGCGAGRFTEYLVNHAKLCVSVDLSTAIFYNFAANSKKLILVKADFLQLIPNMRFDIVICRGVIQHTPHPFKSIKKLHKFVKNDGSVYFDVYKMPKIGYLHPKYFLWRPVAQKFLSYKKVKKILEKRIIFLLKLKKIIRKIFFNSRFIADSIIPIWDHQGLLELNKKQHEKWSILDTLDGLFAKYDKPISYNKIINFLNKNNYKLLNSDKNNNIFETTIK